MKKIVQFLFLCLFCSSYSWAAGSEKDSLDVFLFLGQSNMAGYGTILPEDRVDIPGAYVLRVDENDKKSYSWQGAHQPYNVGHPTYRFSLAGPFLQAHRLMYPEVKVAAVSKAWGGSAISPMSKGTPFYAEIIRQALWAKKSGTLKAILWHQGESDTVSPAVADSYAQKLEKLIKDLRADLGMPNLPFIIGDLAEFYGTHKEHAAPDRLKRIKQVREALKNMQNKLPNVSFVPSTGLISHDEHQVHFNRASYVIFGNRYFDSYWTNFCEK